MRLEPIPPDQLGEEQRRLHEDMQHAAETYLPGVTWVRDDGALLGPFVPMLRWPDLGRPAWECFRAMLASTAVPDRARAVGLLVVSSAYHCDYQLYAHQRFARSVNLSSSTTSNIAAGQRPVDLTASEAVVYDVTASLLHGGRVPETTWSAACRVLGDDGAAALVYLVAGYVALAVLVNGFAVPVPDDAC